MRHYKWRNREYATNYHGRSKMTGINRSNYRASKDGSHRNPFDDSDVSSLILKYARCFPIIAEEARNPRSKAIHSYHD